MSTPVNIGRGAADNGGWLKNVLMWDYLDLAMSGYPGWELDPETKKPYSVVLKFRCGRLRTKPWNLAVKWDDVCKGRFHWREWQDDGSVFVRAGDLYFAQFDFQLKCERDEFAKKHRRYIACLSG